MLIKFVRRVRAKDLIKEFERRYGSLERLKRYLESHPDDYVALMDYEDWKHLLENPDVEVEEGESSSPTFLSYAPQGKGLA